MKKTIIVTSLFVFLVIGLISGFDFFDKNTPTQEPALVAATIFPIADITQMVAGDVLSVATILPPGASPHTMEIKPSDIRNLQSAKKIFMIGHGLDNWAADLAGSVDGVELVTVDRGIRLRSFEGEAHEEHEADAPHDDEDDHDVDEVTHEEDQDHLHEGVDPHYWLSAANAAIITETIRDELIESFPEHAQVFRNNAAEYLYELKTTDDEIKHSLGTLSDPEIIVFHDSWNYFAHEYGLEIAGVFEPAPGREPSPHYLKELHDTAKSSNISVIFSEPQLSSDAVEPFIDDLGLSVVMIDPLGGVAQRDSYINLLRYNADTIYHVFRTDNKN